MLATDPRGAGSPIIDYFLLPYAASDTAIHIDILILLVFTYLDNIPFFTVTLIIIPSFSIPGRPIIYNRIFIANQSVSYGITLYLSYRVFPVMRIEGR